MYVAERSTGHMVIKQMCYLRRRIQQEKSVSEGFGCLGVDCESIGQIFNCKCLHEILESRAEDTHRRIFGIVIRFYSRLRKYIYVQKKACRRSVSKCNVS
jgi:hypothetical protein